MDDFYERELNETSSVDPDASSETMTLGTLSPSQDDQLEAVDLLGLSPESLSPSYYLSDELFQVSVGNEVLVSGNEPSISASDPMTFICANDNKSTSFPPSSSYTTSDCKPVLVGNEDNVMSPINQNDFHEDSERDELLLHNRNSNNNSYFQTHVGNRRSYSQGNSFSKNAIAARENRVKKKKYIVSLEEAVKTLRAENTKLIKEVEQNKKSVKNLGREVTYLKNVIANQSTLSAILKNVSKTPGIKLSTSFNCSPQTSAKCLKRKQPVGGASTSSACVQDDSDDFSESVVQSNCSINRSSQRITRQRKKMQDALTESRSQKEEHQENYDVDVEGSDISDTLSGVAFSSEGTDTVDASDEEGGVCLHVSGTNVSLEFCSFCNSSARSGSLFDHSYVKIKNSSSKV